jgi:hypothetical protein
VTVATTPMGAAHDATPDALSTPRVQPLESEPRGPGGGQRAPQSREEKPRRGWGALTLVLVAALALTIGAIAGGFVGQGIGAGSLASVEDDLARVEADKAALVEEAQAAENSARAADERATACTRAVQVAGKIVENREADLEFWFGPGSVNLPEDPFDPVYEESYARDEAYRRLVGQFESSASMCLGDSGVAAPAGTG